MSHQLAEHGRRIRGEPVTFRARFWSVTRCYPTAEGLVWFKENNPGHRFEPGLISAMAQLAPDSVIIPLAIDRDHGWLLADDHGSTLGLPDVADQPTRCVVVRALAHLQCSLLGSIDPAEHPGLVELAPASAGSRVRKITTEWAVLPATHPLRPDSDLLGRVRRAADHLDERMAALSSSVPLDLELNDVYAANIFGDRSTGALRLRFFDFGNALWAHPFVSLHGFLDSVEDWTGAPLSDTDRNSLYDAYLAVWRDRLDANPQTLLDDLVAVEALVWVHRFISWIRLVPHADQIELQTRAAEVLTNYLTAIAALTG